MFVNDGMGLLFMSSANNGTTLGCQTFDLLQNPFDPPIIASWSGSGHDCHDSYARANVPGSGGKDLLYEAEGYATRYRVIDITNVRSSGTTALFRRRLRACRCKEGVSGRLVRPRHLREPVHHRNS